MTSHSPAAGRSPWLAEDGDALTLGEALWRRALQDDSAQDRPR